MQRNCLFMRAASGRQSKDSMQASYTVVLYLVLPAAHREGGRGGGRGGGGEGRGGEQGTLVHLDCIQHMYIQPCTINTRHTRLQRQCALQKEAKTTGCQRHLTWLL